LEVEAEVDEVLARDAAAADEAAALLGGRPGDEVEPHAREALLEVEEIHRLDAPGHVLALRVDRAVREERHVSSSAQLIRSVRSTTRITSSRLVVPARARRTPSSARVLKPLARAAVRISRAVARRATSSSMPASIFRSSRIAWRPLYPW